MKLSVTRKEAEFLQETIDFGRRAYEEKAQKYLSIEGYRELTMNPTLAMYSTIRAKLSKAIKA